jgi:hypothetical protein
MDQVEVARHQEEAAEEIAATDKAGKARQIRKLCRMAEVAYDLVKGHSWAGQEAHVNVQHRRAEELSDRELDVRVAELECRLAGKPQVDSAPKTDQRPRRRKPSMRTSLIA